MDKIKIIDILNIVALVLGPIIAVCISLWLSDRNYKKQQRDDLLKRLLVYQFQLTTVPNLEIVTALNEIKFRYHKEQHIKDSLGEILKLLNLISTVDKQDMQKKYEDEIKQLLLELVYKIAQKEKYKLTYEEIRQHFSPKK